MRTTGGDGWTGRLVGVCRDGGRGYHHVNKIQNNKTMMKEKRGAP